MDGLRWLLLLFGLLVVAGVYIYSRREHGQENDKDTASDRIETSLLEDKTAPEPDSASAEGDSGAPVAEQKIITLRVVARGGNAFPGDELVLCLRGIGMLHGKFGIYHRYDGKDTERVVFSVASLVEPGNFDLKRIKEQKIPGISIFMVLPGPLEGAEAFDLMMTAARTLSQSLNAELLDESGSTLSIQRERFLREEIIQYQHGIKVA